MSNRTNSGLEAIALMLASEMPIDELINEIEESIQKYRLDPSEKNFKMLNMRCFLLMSRAVVDENGGGIEGVMKVSKQKDELIRKLNFFETNKS